MPFQYQRDDNSRAVGSISELMLRRGDIAAQRAKDVAAAQARGDELSGQAFAGAAQQTGQAVGGAIQQANDPRRQLEQMQVGNAQQMQAGNAQVDSMMRGDQLPAGDSGPRQESYLDANGLFDVPKMNQALASGGMAHLAPDLLKGAESINDSIVKHQALEQQAAQAQTVMYGDMADGALKLAKAGMPIPDAMDFVAQPGLATKRIDPQQYAQIKQKVASLPPDQQVQALTTFMDSAAKIGGGETLAKDSERLDRYGRQIASNVVPEPNKGDYTGPDGIRYHANGSMVTGEVMRIPPPPKSYQKSSVMLDGKPAEILTDPTPGGKVYDLNGTAIDNAAARIKPIPPASIQVNNTTAAAMANLPAWALDDSHPTGPEGNKLDANVRMTPNGLYQAALNYIANGQYPPTGRGSDTFSQLTRTAINSKVGAIAAASGMDEPALRAFFKSNAAALTQEQKQFDAAQANINTADKNVAQLEPLLARIPDTGSPVFNQPLRAFSKSVAGNPDMGPIATYLSSVQNEYGKIITSSNGGQALSDSARHEAQTLIDPNATVAQMLGSIQALKTEGGNRLASIGDQIKTIQGRMTTAPGGNAPAATPKEGTEGSVNGVPAVWKTVNGKAGWYAK